MGNTRRRKSKKARITRYLLLLLLIAIVSILTIVYAMIKPSEGGKKLINKSAITNQNVGNGKKDKNQNEKNLSGVVSTAKIMSMGDILIHASLLEGAKQSDGTYDFTKSFTHVSPLVKQADMSVCNLEVTFGGSNRKYSSFPLFNTPDTLAKALKSSGFDLILTSNNHSYDTGENGLKRTPKILKQAGLKSTGTRVDNSQKPYIITEVNGIKLGVINYTYETPSANGKKALNGNFVSTSASSLVNSFNYDNLQSFYKEIKNRLSQMRSDGAQAIMLYMHWGDEYRIKQNTYQQEIANKMCKFGVDVLIGGHPHVIQPVDVIINEETGNKMACLYSMGNALSNQRISLMDLKTGHTEDGIMFYTTFEKYANGDVKLAKIDYIPTWVNITNINNKKIHQIIPLRDVINSRQSFGMTSTEVQKAKNSYKRTQDLVEDGIHLFNNPNLPSKK